MAIPAPQALNVKVFADGGDLASVREVAQNPLVKGFTSNPTLMRQAGVTDYKGFAKEFLDEVTDRPISFEVFSDEFEDMERQALEISSWGENVYVKIPVTNTRGESSEKLVQRLAEQRVKVNCTALMTLDQVQAMADCLVDGPGAFISVFAGRIADTGRDPIPMMSAALEILEPLPNVELIWASPREVLNILQADAIGCDVITVTHDLLKKLKNLDKDLEEFSLETVHMFRNDAIAAGYEL
jgi:transaldolase